jgi:hypothetical protein
MSRSKAKRRAGRAVRLLWEGFSAAPTPAATIRNIPPRKLIKQALEIKSAAWDQI